MLAAGMGYAEKKSKRQDYLKQAGFEYTTTTMAQKKALLAKEQVECLLQDLVYYGHSTYFRTLLQYLLPYSSSVPTAAGKEKALLAKKQVECLLQDLIYY